MSNGLIHDPQLDNNGILTRCVFGNCNRWGFACMDNRPAEDLSGVCYCKYHFLVNTYSILYEEAHRFFIAVGDVDSVRQQMANRAVVESELERITKEIRDHIKTEDIPPAELATFKQVFGGLFH